MAERRSIDHHVNRLTERERLGGVRRPHAVRERERGLGEPRADHLDDDGDRREAASARRKSALDVRELDRVLEPPQGCGKRNVDATGAVEHREVRVGEATR